MFKKLLATLLALFAAAAFAAVDVNKASQAELEGIKGIGPVIAGKILDERKKGSFKDWPDLVERVKGVGEGNAAKFSTEGLTVNGTAFKGAAPVAAKKDEKPTTKATEKPAAKVEEKPAAKADDKKAAAPSADDKKAAAAKEKADKKAAKAAAAEQAKKDKEAKKAAKSDKAASAAKPADTKASDAKPAKK